MMFDNAFLAYFPVLRKDITILSMCVCLPLYCLSIFPSPLQLLNQLIQIFTDISINTVLLEVSPPCTLHIPIQLSPTRPIAHFT
jgi:hypothetical protein